MDFKENLCIEIIEVRMNLLIDKICGYIACRRE